MGRISLLPSDVIDKISAGEVVESPAAVVKELVENALDAGAKTIAIEIKAGGFQLIRIDDDGIGMDREDALLCLERHATSKIIAAEDLFALDTMGFRGEALAAIAAVSRLTLKTCREGEEPVQVQVEGGKILGAEIFPRERGTTLEVRSLFYNTPARKAFQKTAAASTAEIIRLIIALSLSHPEIDFFLTSQEQSVLKAVKSSVDSQERSLAMRLQNVLGESFYSQALWVSSEDGPYQVHGFIGSPQFTRPNRLGQYLFFNRRWVQSPAVSAWIKDAYGTHIREGSYPHFVLHVNLPKDHVDVNVHPQKKEVRLKEPEVLKKLIRGAVLQGLQGPVEELSVSSPSFTSTPFSFREEGPIWQESWPKTTWEQPSLLETIEFPKEAPPQILALVGSYLLVKGKLEKTRITGGEGTLIADLFSCYARCIYDALSESMQGQKVESTQLFLPITLEFARDEVVRLQNAEEFLSSLGLEIRALGEYTIAIDSYPAFLLEKDVSLIVQMLMAEQESLLLEKEKKVASFCTRFARSRRTPFVQEEARRIWQQLLSSSTPLFCPLGKPSVLMLKEDQMAAFFKGGL